MCISARVTLIRKEGHKCNLSNYRPISVLSVFGKVFEKVAYAQLYDYLEKNSILHKQQYGFRAKKSTTQAIMQYFLYKHVDSGNIVFSLFLDFRKAFNCVNHKVLLSKLNTCGVRGITLGWFRSYLTNREQYVSINNVDPNPRVIQCGVPQGSILGILLFLIFKIISQNALINLNTFFTRMITHFRLVYHVTMLCTLLN